MTPQTQPLGLNLTIRETAGGSLNMIHAFLSFVVIVGGGHCKNICRNYYKDIRTHPCTDVPGKGNLINLL